MALFKKIIWILAPKNIFFSKLIACQKILILPPKINSYFNCRLSWFLAPKFKYLNRFRRENCYLRCSPEPDPDLLHKWFQLGDKPVRQSLPEFGLHGKIPEVPRDIHRYPIDTHLPKTMLRRLRLVQLPRVYWRTSWQRLISTLFLTPFISISRSLPLTERSDWYAIILINRRNEMI